MSPAPTVTGPSAGQAAASDPTRSVWVSASAGTGKTYLLVNRLTRLLLAGTAPGRILCLTFTKAAAAEMADRLNGRLGKWAMMAEADLRGELEGLLGRPPEAADLIQARRLFARCLEVPGGLKIQTIHAFCESLLGRFPLEAGIAPHFTVIEERSAAEILQEARDRVLARAADGDGTVDAAVTLLAGEVDELQFVDLIGEVLNNRSRLRRLWARHGGPDGALAAARRALGVGPADTAETVTAAACAPGEDIEAALRRACAALDAGSDKDRERAAAIAAWLGDPDGRAAAFMGSYVPVFLTQKMEAKAERNLITKKAREADSAASDALLAEQARLVAVVERLKAVAVGEATAALLTIAGHLLDAYEAIKGRRAVLDYDDLILKAQDLLDGPGAAAWVLFKLDGGLDHILVDEAQDTSPEQWAIVAALADEFFAGEGARDGGRTVFAVGDEKQSIYSFQGADPDAFDAMRHHFENRVRAAEQTWQTVPLHLSYRSTPAVLGAVDCVFRDRPARDGLTAADEEIRHESNRIGQAGLVEVWPAVQPADDPEADPWDAPLDQLSTASPQAIVADRIAGQIGAWLHDGEILPSTGRPIAPGDIMILVRTRGAFVDQMVRQLKLRGIPVAGTDRMVLTDQLAVMDLMALADFALLPEDDLNTAVVLKGPLVGFDDARLFDLAYGRKGSLWAALRARRGDDPACSRAYGLLADILGRADRAAPHEFFADLLTRAGGRRALLGRLGPDAGDPIDEFLGLALTYERDHVPSLQGFLHWLKAGRAEIKRDLEQGRGEVRVMTVHGSKGLQADVVFLPDTCSLPGARQDERLRWRRDGGNDGPGDLVLWPVRRANEGALCDELREAARLRREREYRRLLYVAMTRARDRLYVCGWEGRNGRQDGCWYNLIESAVSAHPEAHKILLGPEQEGWRIASPQTAEPERRDTAASTEAAPAAPAWLRQPPPAEPEPARPLTPSRPSGDEPPVVSPLTGDDGARFKRGILVHRLLQTLPDLPAERRGAAAQAFLARPIHGLDAAAVAELAREVLAVIEAPDFAALFGPGSRAEVPLAGVIGDQVTAGQVDRLAVTETTVEIVDFKTNRPPPTRESDVAPLYLRQMAAYRALLGRIYPDRAVRCHLLWTDGPRLMTLSDAALDGQAP